MRFKSKLLVAMPFLPEKMQSKTFYHGTGLDSVEDIRLFVKRGIIPNFKGGNYEYLPSVKGRAYITADLTQACSYANAGAYEIVLAISGKNLTKDIWPDEDSVCYLIHKIYNKGSRSSEIQELKSLVEKFPEKERQLLMSGDPSDGALIAKKLIPKMNEELKIWVIRQPNINLSHKGRIFPTAIYLLNDPTLGYGTSEPKVGSSKLLWKEGSGYTALYEKWNSFDKKKEI